MKKIVGIILIFQLNNVFCENQNYNYYNNRNYCDNCNGNGFNMYQFGLLEGSGIIPEITTENENINNQQEQNSQKDSYSTLQNETKEEYLNIGDN